MERELVSERRFKRQIECVRERLCMESVQQKILKSAENFAYTQHDQWTAVAARRMIPPSVRCTTVKDVHENMRRRARTHSLRP